MNSQSQKIVGKNKISSQVASYGSECETGATSAALVSPARLQECRGLLCQLHKAFSGTLINAQVMQWKLDPYSRSRRYVREIERSAQRGVEVLKQLEERLEIRLEDDDEDVLAENTLGNSPSADGVLAVTSQESQRRARASMVVPLSAPALAAPGSFLVGGKAAHTKV